MTAHEQAIYSIHSHSVVARLLFQRLIRDGYVTGIFFEAASSRHVPEQIAWPGSPALTPHRWSCKACGSSGIGNRIQFRGGMCRPRFGPPMKLAISALTTTMM